MFGILKYIGLVIIVGLGFCQTFVYQRVKKKWASLPLVDATITRSKLKNFANTEGRRIYEAQIEFGYEYKGEKFYSDTPLLRSPQLFKDNNIEHDLLNKYKEGDSVKVRLLPDSPKNAYIEVERFSTLSAIAIPVLFILYGVAVFGYGWMISTAVAS
ncbi:DUF3592 domain-containing protein [Microbulbifer sp. THAF38]|uniref:DUF3592 domain-containing protein n=1 Tax=unclassified Microbulbifer TaxID=2619833 RepID=UPI001267847E|nr:DUF3592 domain-containing protein [Microbulbifer sp. THAF38]QFT54886.1 hypothetical protein FIU95_09995 [Microbulbifer sp. THAF38]